MKFNKTCVFALLTLAAILFTGCNAFESLDRNLDSRGVGTLVEHGNHKLATAQYGHALDLFERAGEKGMNDEVRRGLGYSYGGLGGFNMFSVLNGLQNSVVEGNTSAVFFAASREITDFDAFTKGLVHLNSIEEPKNDDYLLRSLMGVCGAAHLVYLKFDTYKNQKLESSDQITFVINDKEQGTWESFYENLSDGSELFALEKAYVELAIALEGRGIEKTTMTPFQNIINTGLYTEANFKTIGAVEKFATVLQLANNAYYAENESLFKQHIMSLDDEVD